MQDHKKKKQEINRENVRFEISQGIGWVDESNKIGLTQPTTGADTLNKGEQGNESPYTPRFKATD
ncbi:hypothetical protein V6C32_06830 [Desulforamulus ruminis]|uniref:hypothetical protein n=1 Tax=Desulforamulus ruminis TaxID=1564 RepID=UPI002FD8BA94